MSFKASVLTLYPDMFPGTLGQALAGKALASARTAFDARERIVFQRDLRATRDRQKAGAIERAAVEADHPI